MEPNSEQRGKISEKLTTGIGVLTAAVGITAAYEGGLARVSLNESKSLLIAVGLIVLSIAIAFASWAVVEKRAWRALAAAALLTSVGGIGIGLNAVRVASKVYDRPQVSARYDGKALEFTAEIALLRADTSMTVTVTGYPARVPDPIPGFNGEDRGSQLYFTTTGPSPDGTAHLEARVPVNPKAYEQVEVRVYPDDEDPQCLRRPQAGESERRRPAGCAIISVQPRAPVLQCDSRGSPPSERSPRVTRVPCPD